MQKDWAEAIGQEGELMLGKKFRDRFNKLFDDMDELMGEAVKEVEHTVSERFESRTTVTASGKREENKRFFSDTSVYVGENRPHPNVCVERAEDESWEVRIRIPQISKSNDLALEGRELARAACEFVKQFVKEHP